jgi:uncharacterized protein YycO
MNRLKSGYFSSIVIFITFFISFLLLVFIGVEIAKNSFLIGLVFFFVFIILNIYHKNWKALILNLVMIIGLFFVTYIFLEWATLRMYQGASEESDFNQSSEIQNGDLIFQISKSPQSQAIQMATGSKYSHMGIVYKQGNEYFVYEAIQPVKLTRMNNWINRGVNKHYVVKRVKNASEVLTPHALSKMKKIGEKYAGKDYDLYFEWSDSRIYCSELVWKIYKEALGIEIGELKKLGDFNLNDMVVKQKLKERYGENIPENELVISPASMFDSDKLITVIEN